MTDIDNLDRPEEIPTETEYLEGDPTLTINNDSEADNTMEIMAYWERQAQEVERVYDGRRDRLEEWKRRRLDTIERKLAYHNAGLSYYLDRLGIKKKDLPAGTFLRKTNSLQVVNPPNELEVVANLVELEEYQQFVRTKITHTLDRSAILKHFKDTGEEVPGITIDRKDPTFQVKLNTSEPVLTNGSM